MDVRDTFEISRLITEVLKHEEIVIRSLMDTELFMKEVLLINTFSEFWTDIALAFSNKQESN